MVYICPQQALKFTCESDSAAQLGIQWRIVFEGSRSLSAVTHSYIPSDQEGLTNMVTRNGLNFVFNLTVNSPSQLASTLKVTMTNTTGTRNGIANTTITVYCPQESHIKAVIAFQGN